MGWFTSKWFKRKKKPALPAPAMIVLLDRLVPMDAEAAKAAATALAAIEPLRLYPKFDLAAAAGTELGKEVEYGHVDFDSHRVRLVGLPAPVPESVLETTVRVSHWPVAQREAMAAHGAHMILWHEGGGASQRERFIALYKLAAVLGGDRLRGVVIEDSWTCAPPEAVRDFLQAKFLVELREAPMPFLFTGYVTSFDDAGAWFMSKGNHYFGVPDLVYHGPRDTDPGEALEIVMQVFMYLTGGAKILPGHTAQIAEEVFLKFSLVPENHSNPEWLKGAGETLVLEKISKDQINTGKK